MAQGHPLVIIGDRTLFQVNVSESFVVPTSVPTLSPTADYVPSAVQGTFKNNRPSVGGQLLLAVKDGAGPNNASAFEVEIYPGDTIALSAVASNTVQVNRTPQGSSVAINIGQITGVTSAASVVGWYA